MIDLADTFTSSIEVYTAPPEPPTNGTLTNAGTVVLTITLPDRTTITPTPVNSSTGKYKFDHIATMVGRHVFRWVTTSPSTAYVDVMEVAAADPGGIVSLAQAQSHLNFTGTPTTGNDEELRLMIGAATGIIEDKVGPVVRRTITNERHPGGAGAVWLHHTPVISVTSVTQVADGVTTVSPTLLDPDEHGRVVYKNGYTAFPYGTYFWTYEVGRAVVPASIQEAALELVKGLWETQRGASGLPLQGMDDLAAQPGMGLVMWRVEQLLQPYRAMPGIA